MKKKIWIWVGGLLVALMVVGAVGTAVAYAQGTTPSTVFGDGRGPGGGHGPLGSAELEAAAKALDMTTDELSTALKDGKSLQDLADAAGVELQSVQDAIQAAHATEMRTQIEQAVTDGNMTREKADWLLEGLDKGFLDGPGFGLGGPGHGPKLVQTPSAQPTQSSDR